MSDDLRERIAQALRTAPDRPYLSADEWWLHLADAVLAALSDAPTVEDRILEANEFFKSKGVGYDLPAPTVEDRIGQVLDRLSPACRAEFLRLWRDPTPTEQWGVEVRKAVAAMSAPQAEQEPE